MNRVIRPATHTDLNDCHALCKVPELKTPAGNYPPRFWIDAIIKEKQIALLALEEEKPIGFVMGERIAGNWSLLHLMVVSKTYRNKGVGTDLLHAFEYEVKKRKLGGIVTYAYGGNKKTLQFFVKNKYLKGATVIECIKPLKP